MAFKLRVCKNKTTDLLRNTFHATPVTPPESTIRPLFVLSRLDGKVSRRGDLKFLFPKKYHKALNLEFSRNRVADTSLQRTQKVDMGMGVQIMGALLQGFKIDTAPVTAALRTDWRYCLRSCLDCLRASMPASSCGGRLGRAYCFLIAASMSSLLRST